MCKILLADDLEKPVFNHALIALVTDLAMRARPSGPSTPEKA